MLEGESSKIRVSLAISLLRRDLPALPRGLAPHPNQTRCELFAAFPLL